MHTKCRSAWRSSVPGASRRKQPRHPLSGWPQRPVRWRARPTLLSQPSPQPSARKHRRAHPPSVSSSIVVSTSTKGTPAMSPANSSGAMFAAASNRSSRHRSGRDPGSCQEHWTGSALPEHPRQLIRDGLEKIAQHRPAFGLQEDFRRHSWRQLQVPKALYLLLLQGNPHIVICA